MIDPTAHYRCIRTQYLATCERADAAFLRWFKKREAGLPTNAAQATRLSNEASLQSALFAQAENRLYAADIDPRSIDRIDGITYFTD